jgi:hypothetical protein
MALGAGQELGYSSWLGVAEESAWGTHMTATNFLEFNSESLNKKKEGKIIESMGSTGRNPLKRYLGNTEVNGTVECFLNIFEPAICQIINNCFGGTITSSGDATNGFNHIVAQGNMVSGTSSLSFTKRVGSNLIWQFDGCRVNSLTLKGEIGEPLQLTGEIIGKDATVCTDSVTVVLDANNPLLWSGINFEVAETTTSLDGSTGAEIIEGFEFTYSNGLISDSNARALGSDVLSILPVGRATASLKITQRFEGTLTSHDRAFNLTKQCVRISMDSGVTLGSEVSGTTGSLMITFPDAYMETENVIPSTDGPGLIMSEFVWVPLQPTSAVDYVSVEYNNNTASF